MIDHENLAGDVLGYLKSDKFKSIRELIKKTNLNNPYDPHRQSNQYLMWLEQCNINFPLMYLSSIYLDLLAKKRGLTTFLFATRDCCHWNKIFKKMFPHSDSHYFHCSRNMFELATEKKHEIFGQYVRSLVDSVDKAIFIDIHGTGKRALAYFEKEFGVAPDCLLLSATSRNYDDFPVISRDYARKNKLVNLVFDARGTPIEMLNYDIRGTLQNYTEDGPLRDKLEYDMSLLEAYHTCIDYMVSQLKEFGDTDNYNLDELTLIIRKVYNVILNDHPALAEYIKHPSKHVKNVQLMNAHVPIKKAHSNQLEIKVNPPVTRSRSIKSSSSSSSSKKSNLIDWDLAREETSVMQKLDKKALKEKMKAEKKAKKLKEKLAKEASKKNKKYKTPKSSKSTKGKSHRRSKLSPVNSYSLSPI